MLQRVPLTDPYETTCATENVMVTGKHGILTIENWMVQSISYSKLTREHMQDFHSGHVFDSLEMLGILAV